MKVVFAKKSVGVICSFMQELHFNQKSVKTTTIKPIAKCSKPHFKLNFRFLFSLFLIAVKFDCRLFAAKCDETF